MNRVAAFQTAVCTLAISALSAGTATFVFAAQGGGLDWLRAIGAVGCVALGSWLVYVGHCRGMLNREG